MKCAEDVIKLKYFESLNPIVSSADGIVSVA